MHFKFLLEYGRKTLPYQQVEWEHCGEMFMTLVGYVNLR